MSAVASAETQKSNASSVKISPAAKSKKVAIRIVSDKDEDDYIQKTVDVTNICKKSNYLRVVLDDCEDSELATLVEEDPEAAMNLLTRLSKDEMPPNEWDMKFSKLSAKWIIPKFVSHYERLITEELRKMKSKESFPVKFTLVRPSEETASSDKSATRTQKKAQVVSLSMRQACGNCGGYVNASSQQPPQELIRLGNGTFCPILHTRYGACYDSPEYILRETSPSNWDVVTKANDQTFNAHSPKSGQLLDQTGYWTFSNVKTQQKDQYGRNQSYYGLTTGNYTLLLLCETVPNIRDLNLFAEICEVVLTHDCYRDGCFFKKKEDLLSYLAENRDLWDITLLGRLLDKDDLVELLVHCKNL